MIIPQLLPLLFCFLLSLIRVAISNEIFSRVYHYLSMKCGNLKPPKTSRLLSFIIICYPAKLAPNQPLMPPSSPAPSALSMIQFTFCSVYLLLFLFFLVFLCFLVVTTSQQTGPWRHVTSP